MFKNNKLTSIILFIFLCQFLNMSPVLARWATLEDAPALIEFYNSEMTVDKEGKSVEVIEKQTKILNEKGRIEHSVQRLHYNENIEKVEIIEAKTIIDGKEYIVPKEMIEKKPLASEIHGFDQLFQILISFPHVNPGTQIYLKYKITTFKQALPKYFALKYYYGAEAYWQKGTFKLKSELPFTSLLNDPNKHMRVKESKNDQFQTIEITLTKPTYTSLINEPQNNQIPDSAQTWFYISTYRSFDTFEKDAAKDYETVINEELPPMQESIRKAAAAAKSPIDQINTVTSLLSEKVRYMGDWRTIEGRLSPRPLKIVASSGVGDCKDFSASTVAILNALGFKAHAALVWRGVAYLPPSKSLPSYLNTNHAIVKATAKDGTVFWVDPTNFVSMAGGIFPDISDRPVFVLDSKDPKQEAIPQIDAQRSGLCISDSIEIKDHDILKTTGTERIFGEQAQSATGAALTHSLKEIEEFVIKGASGEASPLNTKVTLPPLNSRIVKDLEIGYSFEQENNLLLTNEGPGILLSFNWPDGFIDISADQEGTMFVGLPSSLSRTTLIKDVDVETIKSLEYSFKTPWVEATRACHVANHGVEIKDKITILKSFVTKDDVKSQKYKELRNMMKKYCTKFTIIVRQKQRHKNP